MAHRSSPRHRSRLALALAGAGLVVACAETPRAPSPAPAAPVPTAPAPAPEPAPAPAPQPAAPAPALPDGVAAGSPAAQQLAQRAATAAVELLEAGNEEQANTELQRALQADPANKLAAMLLKQIQTDPQTLLGRENFSYRVQAGESLSRIAGRFLGDVHLFYALARYNDIRVPRQLQGGQLLKVPGKAPPPSAAPAPAPAPVPPSPPPQAQPAPAPAPAVAAPAPKPPDERAAQRERQARIAAATKAARSAFARQDLDGAIRQWDLVLELDPNNNTAQLERKKASDLRDKLGRVK